MCRDWTQFEGIEDSPLPQGWSGPFKGKYLEVYTYSYKSRDNYDTLEQALEAADKVEKCGGVTYSKKYGFTLRNGNNPVGDKESHISWTKNK